MFFCHIRLRVAIMTTWHRWCKGIRRAHLLRAGRLSSPVMGAAACPASACGAPSGQHRRRPLLPAVLSTAAPTHPPPFPGKGANRPLPSAVPGLTTARHRTRRASFSAPPRQGQALTGGRWPAWTRMLTSKPSRPTRDRTPSNTMTNYPYGLSPQGQAAAG